MPLEIREETKAMRESNKIFEIRSHFTDWKEVSEYEYDHYVLALMMRATEAVAFKGDLIEYVMRFARWSEIETGTPA